MTTLEALKASDEVRRVSAPPVHMVEVFRGEVLESDYRSTHVGDRVYMARCSCGWSVVRQFEHATRNQVGKHRKAVAS